MRLTGQSEGYVPAILYIAARGPGAGHLARISDADGGDRRRPRGPIGGEFLLPVARGAGEGRTQSRQVRPRVRHRFQGAGEPARCDAEGRHPRGVAEEARGKVSTEDEKKQIEAMGWDKL